MESGLKFEGTVLAVRRILEHQPDQDEPDPRNEAYRQDGQETHTHQDHCEDSAHARGGPRCLAEMPASMPEVRAQDSAAVEWKSGNEVERSQ